MEKPSSVRTFFPDAQPIWPKTAYTGSPLRLDQISFLVHNLEEAIEFWGTGFGISPFYIARVRNVLPYRGKNSPFEVRLAFANLSDGIELELMEVVEGETPHQDHLLEKGPGIQHIRMATQDVEGTLQHLVKMGIEPIFGYKMDDRWVNVYINSQDESGVRVELIRDQVDPSRLETSWRISP